MAFRSIWRYVVGRTKSVVKNYNVIERAEKVVEHGKKVAPRHPGTEAKFQVLVKVITDESWMFEYGPETSMELYTKSCPCPMKSCMNRSNVKTIHIFSTALDYAQRIVLPGQIVNLAFTKMSWKDSEYGFRKFD
ncbi:hypothetical protein NPIL_338241 [Nephila pilipes]|uniref:Uncharacterized protein n=1 Tax=Nephila pilipes TaxID=299642 RepID=A0A8X6PVJ9_NEPPI|nr:hypothetical protein NPIL_338241 [Nephila pilipes]